MPRVQSCRAALSAGLKFKMAKQTEPEYMELRKDSAAVDDKEKESEVHIYELDVPKVPELTESKSKSQKETKKEQSSALEYHYVRNNDSRVSQMHLSTLVATVEKDGAHKRFKDELETRMRDRRMAAQRRRRPSLKSVAIIVLFILTIINTILAVAALVIAGQLHTSQGIVQRGVNDTQTGT